MGASCSGLLNETDGNHAGCLCLAPPPRDRSRQPDSPRGYDTKMTVELEGRQDSREAHASLVGLSKDFDLSDDDTVSPLDSPLPECRRSPPAEERTKRRVSVPAPGSCMDVADCRKHGEAPDSPLLGYESPDPTQSELIGGVPGFHAERASPAKVSVAFAKKELDTQSVGSKSSSSTARGRSSRTRAWKTNKSNNTHTTGVTSEELRHKRSGRVANLISGRSWVKEEGGNRTSARTSKVSEKAPKNYTNSNLPQDYKWLESVLESIALNKAGTLGCKDHATGQGFVPVFFVLGACPNIFCGMQAIMYSVNTDGEVDFWWVKPGKSDANGHLGVEVNTLSRHAKGPHKNDPGRSKPFYKPLADLFKEEQVVEGIRFGIEKGSQGSSSRAFLEQVNGGRNTRQYMHLVWQEDWTTNPFSRSKYIKGKIVYQKDPQSLQFHSRQYYILNGSITVSHEEEAPFYSVLPGEEIKDLRAD